MNIASYIDHTLLKATATENEIQKLCNEAIQFQFAAVCINPIWVNFCRKFLRDTNVKTCTVIGFPLGANTLQTKIFELQDAIKNGAEECDVVLNIGYALNNDIASIEKELQQIVETANKRVILKLILETCYLNEVQKIKTCQMAVAAGFDYLKTSTGLGVGGATLEDVALLKKYAQQKFVKASGGIKTKQDAIKMIQAGATRIGTSSGVAMMTTEKELTSLQDY